MPLRAQPSEQADFIESALPSGTAVTLVDASPIDGFVLVRLTDGTEGYILSQYLMDQPIARDLIKTLKTELEQSILDQAGQRSELNKTEQLAAEYLERAELLSEENKRLSTEFEGISNLSQETLKKEEALEEALKFEALYICSKLETERLLSKADRDRLDKLKLRI